MSFRLSVLAVLLSTAGAMAQGEGCSGPGYADAWALVESHYANDPIALFNTQLQVNAVAGRQVLTPDGKWGPATASQVCDRLQTYATINGAPPDEYIVSESDAAYFVDWIGSMARMNLNPGMYEAPD